MFFDMVSPIFYIFFSTASHGISHSNWVPQVSSYLGPDMSQYKQWLQLAMQRPMGCWAPTILGTLMVADGARTF